jgi:hypothetical protein
MSIVHVPFGRPRRRDWFRILRDLAKAGVSMGEVARRCGRDRSTVQAWAEGSEPKDSDARVVLALYAKHCAAEYVEHQKQFEIRVLVDDLTQPGDQLGLKFVEI